MRAINTVKIVNKKQEVAHDKCEKYIFNSVSQDNLKIRPFRKVAK